MILPDARLLATAAMLSCPALPASAQTVEIAPWGETAGGEVVERCVLANSSGLSAEIMTWGATLIGVHVPDREGRLANITLHLGSFAEYEKGHPLLGSVVGRFANRISGGGFTIDGARHELHTVNPATGVHIHGGRKGLARQLWKAEPLRGEGWAGVVLRHSSPAGHEGYPGALDLAVIYRLREDNSLEIEYRGATDQATHLNLTNHAYFNLSGAGAGDILGHLLELRSDQILAIDERKIPTGELLPVEGTPFDFRQPRAIGERIAEVEGGGYDHCYVLSHPQTETAERQPVLFARLVDPASGRAMEALATQPGVQLYTGNYLKPELATPGGRPYGPWHGLCLETQHFPDTPNQPGFPSTVLRPGEEYRELTVFRFSTVP